MCVCLVLFAIILTLPCETQALERRLPPQTALGGSDEKPRKGDGITTEFPCGFEGAEGMTCYLFRPNGVQAGRRYPLLFVLHGNGDGGKGRHGVLTKVSCDDAPVFVVGIQYQKEAKFNAATWSNEVTFGAFFWLLDKVSKEQPVDPAQLYVQGFSMGGNYISWWSSHEQQRAARPWPFRAHFHNSGCNPGRKARPGDACPAEGELNSIYPDVPMIVMVGEKETAVLGSINVVEQVQAVANNWQRLGHEVHYHMIPDMEHSVNGRCIQIIRETIAAFAPKESGLALPPQEAPEVEAAAVLLRGFKLKEGRAALDAFIDSGAKAKPKKQARDLRKTLDTWAKTEAETVDKRIAATLKANKTPALDDLDRLGVILDAYASEKWAERLTKPLAGYREHDLVKRELGFAAAYDSARALELSDVPAAKAAWDKLRSDASSSAWGRAAAWRLTWWRD